MKYKVTYEYKSTRYSIVEADSEDEAKDKYIDGEYIEDCEDDGYMGEIIDVEETV